MRKLIFLPLLFAVWIASGVVFSHFQTSGQQTSAPAHVTLVDDDEGNLIAAYETSTHEPIPLHQLQQMMMSAQAPNIDNVVRWMKGGMWVMPKPPPDAGLAPSATQLITRISTCQCDEDFAAIAFPYFGVNPNTCTCPGVRMGDRCMTGVLQATPADGGSAFIRGMDVVPIARADNLIELDVYNQLGDAGSLDPPDAGYVTTCFSNAPLAP